MKKTHPFRQILMVSPAVLSSAAACGQAESTRPKPATTHYANSHYLYYNDTDLKYDFGIKGHGRSVRCVRD